MDNLLALNIIVDICGILFCVIGSVVFVIWRKFLNTTFKYYFAIFCVNAISLLANMIGLILKGTDGLTIRMLLRFTNFIEFTSGYTLSLLFTLFLFYYIEKAGGKIKYKKWAVMFFVVVIALVLVSQFNGMYYYIDSANFYHRGELFFVSRILGIVAIAVELLIVIINHKYFRKTEIISFFIYILFPIVALIVQLYIYGIYILLLLTTISAFIMMIMILSVEVEKFYEKENQLLDMRVRLTLSQMQPHFLFNSLVAIKYLYKVDSKQATQTIDDFSYYLRANIDSIACDRCIPFNTEIEHANKYLSLEQKRFGERLNIIFDLKEKDFYIPPLSLLTIIENSVKYGMSWSIEGVEIKISSYSDEKNYYIEVLDNGPGFDPSNYKNDGKNHVGIDGVKICLKNMCNGTLNIDSVIEKGTRVTIIIPKEIR